MLERKLKNASPFSGTTEVPEMMFLKQWVGSREAFHQRKDISSRKGNAPQTKSERRMPRDTNDRAHAGGVQSPLAPSVPNRRTPQQYGRVPTSVRRRQCLQENHQWGHSLVRPRDVQPPVLDYQLANPVCPPTFIANSRLCLCFQCAIKWHRSFL